MPIGRAAFIAIIFLFTYCICNTASLYAGENPRFMINPLQSVSLGFVNLSTTYPRERYTFPNQNGTFADKGLNYYFSVAGAGSVASFIDFNYDLRANNIEGVSFKKGSVFFRTDAVSLEIGRNNIWLGHSHYGSLLLSNNAEPYTLVRFRTERPFRIPYIGNFDYTLFHGWPRNFNMIGHKLSWHPASWLELNLKQTIVYSGNYRLSDYFLMFTGREANLREGVGETDSRASFEIAVDMGFLSALTPAITGAKIYAEYGGEDLYAYWQTADVQFDKDLWVGPFGFELLDTGVNTGLLVQTTSSEFVFEYAQNYKNHYIFYDPYRGSRPYNSSWYRHKEQPRFQNNGAILGHHMGTAAEMVSLHLTNTFSVFTTSFSLSRRHRWHIRQDSNDVYYKASVAERQDSFSGMLQYNQELFDISLLLIFNRYKNTDSDMELLNNRPQAGVTAEEFLAGIIFKIHF